jgi:hypothetical protein
VPCRCVSGAAPSLSVFVSTAVAPVRFPLRKKYTKENRKKKTKEQKKDRERGTIGSATSVSNRLGLAACLFLLCLCSFQIFPFSFLSALVISSVCDGFSTLI